MVNPDYLCVFFNDTINRRKIVTTNPEKMLDRSRQDTTKIFINLLVPSQHRIQAFITMLVPNMDDAEDIYQETLTEMWNKFDSFQPGTNFVAWSLKIAKYKILNYRKRSFHKKLIFSDQIFDLIDSASESKLNSLNNRLDILQGCVKKLTKNETQLLQLRYEHELTLNKISDRIGKSSPMIHHMISLILSKLALCVRRNLQLEENS